MSNKVKAHIRYRLADKTVVPGLTTVLGLLNKPALVPWANKLGLKGIDVSKFVDDKADIGTLGHAFVTDKLEGKETDTSDYSRNQIDAAMNCALSFWEWEKNHPIDEIYFCERPLVSETHRFGATLDIYGKFAGRKEIIDLKTGTGIYPEHVYQVSTLKKLLEEHGNEIEGVRVLNIPRTEDESFAEKVPSEKEMEAGWQIFQHLLAVYNLKKVA
ncbi:MAG: hypothetical protein ABFD82_23585 [Syntrophaceae bacterium]